MAASDRIPRFSRIRNFRDVGGMLVPDGGVVRTGLLYRSGHLGDATPRDVARLEALGIRTTVDLRSPRDASGKPPSRVPPGTRLVECPVSGDHPGWRSLARRDPVGTWQHVLRPGAADTLMRDTYVSHALDHAPAFGAALRALAEPGALPAIVHCRQGKDRTGWLVALVLDSLGVARADITADFLRSNDAAPLVVGGPLLRQAVRPLARADRRWLDIAFDVVITRFGSMSAYRREAAGVDLATEQALRSALVDPIGV